MSWQPGIQEGAADWDENWDKFEDEVKHLPQKRVYMFHLQMLIISQKRHQVEEKGFMMMLTAKMVSADERNWGVFDTHYDTDSGWDFSSGPIKLKVVICGFSTCVILAI
ncbi:hypothetical protein CsSME_00003158 [Camellia sinensis var. sinensis]